METGAYDPIEPGGHAVGVRTSEVLDLARDRLFPCEIWYPARTARDQSPSPEAMAGPEGQVGAEGPAEVRDAIPLPGPHPLVIFSHHSGGHRRSSTFLCSTWPVTATSSRHWITPRWWPRNWAARRARRRPGGPPGSTP
jgi:predicted dienelactone hydrolase